MIRWGLNLIRLGVTSHQVENEAIKMYVIDRSAIEALQRDETHAHSSLHDEASRRSPHELETQRRRTEHTQILFDHLIR